MSHGNKGPGRRREQNSLCVEFKTSERGASGCGEEDGFGLGSLHVEELASFLDRAWPSEKHRSA